MPKLQDPEIQASAHRLTKLSPLELQSELSKLQRVFSNRSFTEVEEAQFSFIQFLLNQRTNSRESRSNKLR